MFTIWPKLRNGSVQLCSIRYRNGIAAEMNITKSEEQVSSTAYENALPIAEMPGGKQWLLGGYFKLKKVPFANTSQYSPETYHHFLRARYKQFGPIWWENIPGNRRVHLAHPAYFKQVYQQEGKTPHIHYLVETGGLYRRKRDMSPGLGNSNGESWHRLRSAISKIMLRPLEVNKFLSNTQPIASEFVDKLDTLRNKDGEVEDLTSEVARYVLEISTMNSFGMRFGALGSNRERAQRIIDAQYLSFHHGTKMKFSIPFYEVMATPTIKNILESEDYFFGEGQKLVDATVENIKIAAEKGQLADNKHMFMKYLLSRKEISYKDVSIISLSLFGDSLLTIGPAILTCLYCLAVNPDVQQKLYTELKEKVTGDGNLTPEIIHKLRYLKACVKETFRLFPPGTEISRIPQQDMVIGGYKIPAGTALDLNNFVLFEDEKYFTEPHRYMPERWLRGGSAQNVDPYVMLPFSHGARMCPGRRFAEQDIYTAITKIIQQYSLEWHYPPLEQTFRLLMFPSGEMKLKFVNR